MKVKNRITSSPNVPDTFPGLGKKVKKYLASQNSKQAGRFMNGMICAGN